MAPPQKRDRPEELDDDFTNDVLELYGGWVLLVTGVALIALAFVFRSYAAVAPTSLVLGVLCVVLAVILARTEGALKFGTHGVEAVLRRVKRRARKDRSLGQGQKQDVVEYVEDVLMAPAANAAMEDARVADPNAIAATNLNRFFLLQASLYDDARRAVLSFEGRVRSWLERQGWTVTEAGGAGFPDFEAERDGELMWVETKARKSPVTREHLNQWVSQLVRTQHKQAIDRFALFVSAPRFTHSALEAARRTRGVDIYLETGIGEFEAIAPSSSR